MENAELLDELRKCQALIQAQQHHIGHLEKELEDGRYLRWWCEKYAPEPIISFYAGEIGVIGTDGYHSCIVAAAYYWQDGHPEVSLNAIDADWDLEEMEDYVVLGRHVDSDRKCYVEFNTRARRLRTALDVPGRFPLEREFDLPLTDPAHIIKVLKDAHQAWTQ